MKTKKVESPKLDDQVTKKSEAVDPQIKNQASGEAEAINYVYNLRVSELMQTERKAVDLTDAQYIANMFANSEPFAFLSKMCFQDFAAGHDQSQPWTDEISVKILDAFLNLFDVKAPDFNKLTQQVITLVKAISKMLCVGDKFKDPFVQGKRHPNVYRFIRILVSPYETESQSVLSGMYTTNPREFYYCLENDIRSLAHADVAKEPKDVQQGVLRLLLHYLLMLHTADLLGYDLPILMA